jgi:hypothetical protein
MEDKIYKVVVALTVVAALAIPLFWFIGGTLKPVAFISIAAFIVLLGITIWMNMKLGKDVMDLKCAVAPPPAKEFKPGDTVNYTAEFATKEPFELERFSVRIVATYNGEKGQTQVAHKEKRVHLENKHYVTGNVEKMQGSFKLPDNANLFGARHSWTLVFHCEIKSILDKTETIEFIKNDKSLPFWDAV